MRAPDLVSIWLKLTVLRDTALKSFTGMLTRPKLIDPLQMARGMATTVTITRPIVHVNPLDRTVRDSLVHALWSVRRSRQDGAGYEIHAEPGEDGQVQQTRGRHDRGVLLLAQRGSCDDHESDGRDGASDPEPAEQAVVAVVDGAVQRRHHPPRPQHDGEFGRPHVA